MNRHQRRAASKAPETKEKIAAPAAQAEPIPPSQPPRLALRVAAFLLLSPWMLRRVHNAQVLGMLREVARQAGRESVARQLDERIKNLR